MNVEQSKGTRRCQPRLHLPDGGGVHRPQRDDVDPGTGIQAQQARLLLGLLLCADKHGDPVRALGGLPTHIIQEIHSPEERDESLEEPTYSVGV